jgi:hypothetical protein
VWCLGWSNEEGRGVLVGWEILSAVSKLASSSSGGSSSGSSAGSKQHKRQQQGYWCEDRNGRVWWAGRKWSVLPILLQVLGQSVGLLGPHREEADSHRLVLELVLRCQAQRVKSREGTGQAGGARSAFPAARVLLSSVYALSACCMYSTAHPLACWQGGRVGCVRSDGAAQDKSP